MRIAIHNGDGINTGFPNLALMKISAWHKARGDSVEWYNSLTNYENKYDKVYSSKVFTFTPKDPYLPSDAILGGTGYGRKCIDVVLPKEIDSCDPDYALYPKFPHALGFITRWCIRNCPWCIVPKKEGVISQVADALTIVDGRKSAVFMDNNFLAHELHPFFLGELEGCGVKVDFNQGLDARLVTEENAPMLARVKWMNYIRFSCDTLEMLPVVENAARLVREHGYKDNNGHGKEVFCYVLVRDVGEADAICERFRDINISPFAQAYMDYSGDDKRTKEQKDFCRYVNNKAIFKSVKWNDYKRSVKK